MAIDIICNSNFLRDVFDKKYCEFLENTDNKKEELEKLLNVQNNKKNVIINSIYECDTYIENREIYQKIILKVQDVMDESITKLTQLIENIKILNMAVIRLIVDKSSNTKYKVQETMQTVCYIEDKVDEFLKNEKELNKKIKKDEKIIGKYLKNPHLIEEQKDIETEFEDISNIDEEESVLKEEINIINECSDDIKEGVEKQEEILDQKNEEKQEPKTEEKRTRRRHGSAIDSDDFLMMKEEFKENNTLLISEKEGKVYLPYNISQLKDYMQSYPDDYESYQDVVNSEFVLPLDIFMKNQSLARFKETYELIRNKELKSMVDAVRCSTKLMFKYDLNPAIIAACKTQNELDFYLECMESNNLSNFDCFDIKFDLNLM